MRYPKLHFFNGSFTQRVRVNRLSNYFLDRAINLGVRIENKQDRHKPPQKVIDAMISILKKRKYKVSHRGEILWDGNYMCSVPKTIPASSSEARKLLWIVK
jgi:hypothetical protein